MDVILLTLSIISGQLVKFSIGRQGGLTLLDIAVIILCAVGLFRTRLKLINPPLWIRAAFVFILVALASLILTPITLTQSEYIISISYTIRFSLYILLGWLIYSNAFPALRGNIQNILLTSGALLAVLGLLQFIFLPDLEFLTKYGWDPHYFRTASTFLDPNFLGSFLVLTLILWYKNFKGVKKLYLFFGIIVYIALLMTFSRGAYLGFLTAFLTLALPHRSLKLGLLTALLFFGLMLGFLTYERLIAEPRNIDRTQSAEFRLGIWQQGWQIFQTNPILGVGFNTYKFALREYKLGDQHFLQSRGSSTNDSSLLYVVATTGILGLTAYLGFLLSLFLGTGGKILPAALVGILAQSFFANTLFYPFILIWIVLIAANHKK